MPFVYISSSGSEGCSPKKTDALVHTPSVAVERSASARPAGSPLASTVIGYGPSALGHLGERLRAERRGDLAAGGIRVDVEDRLRAERHGHARRVEPDRAGARSAHDEHVRSR